MKTATVRRPIPPHIRRVRIEEEQLRRKRARLAEFMQTMAWHTLAPAERRRMKRQLRAMTLYRDVLVERIEAAGAELLP